ncbi:histidine kinase [Marivirga harenae]|uniref:sensor histidine kinase n=1 Tax=Marivirga harenae TaxID=2010992 RepID=UPI0026E083AA|nr:histidine kinase [Marivirga harenae]WKV11620.1 histidine kinase [Marivirga harenae]|tara:strand:+ start:123386 stop:124186 length:801 start_codon:yes stop_codon:yes gene_type:complete
MDGSKEIIFLTLAIGASGMLTLAVGIILFVFFYQRKLLKRKIAYQKVEDLLNEQELKNAYSLLEGQEKERQRISKELHDNLGSLLVTANLSIDALPKEQLDTNTREKIGKIDSLIQKAANETRKISHSLDSGLLKHFGLKASLIDLAATLDELTHLKTHFDIQLKGTFSNEINTELYRIIQELINNTLKHAQAKNIRLEVLELKDKYINIIYEDDGLGFDLNESGKVKGIGLQNIDNRVSKLYGKITLDSAREKGITVIIEIPVNE